MKRILTLTSLLLFAGLAQAQSAITKNITAINTAATTSCSANSCLAFDMAGKGGATVQVTGTYTASGGLSLQRTVDGTTWETVTSTSAFLPVSGTGTATIASAAVGTWQIGGACTGFLACRVTALGAVTGTAPVTINTTTASVGGSASITGGGDASAANQTTGNASLASIDGKLPASTAHDAVATSVNPLLVGGYASAAAPTNVSADGDATRQWLLRSGATAVQPTLGGVLASAGSGTNGTGVQRVTLATDDALITAVNADPNYTQAPGSAAPSRAIAMGARSGANLVALSQASASAAINVSTATTTQLVALSSGQVIHVTALSTIAGGTGNLTFVYGTGSSCGTGTTSLTGAYPLIANAGISLGGGLGPVLVVPAGNALCVTTSAAVQMSGHVAYTQFTP